MPLTPFHLGPALLLGLIFFKYVHFPTFLLANIIIDIEPFLVIVLNLDYPIHGFFHSFAGGIILAIPLTLVMVRIKGNLSPLVKLFRVEQRSSFKNVVIASLSGLFIHVLLDSRMHSDMKPFFPFELNPFLHGSWQVIYELYSLCSLMFIGGVIFYIIKYRR